MAKNEGAVARLTGRFPPGTRVGLYRGHTDTVPRDEQLGAAFKTHTVDKHGTVEFSGLDHDERLFIAGVVEDDVPRPGERVPQRNWRYVAIHAAIPREERKPDSDKAVRTALASTLSPHEPDRTVVGARGSRSLARGGQPFASAQAGHPTPKGAPDERTPHLRQEDARDVEQRSATFTGQATPVDPGEQVPQPAQHKIKDGRLVPNEDGIDMEQRSATPQGELTPIPKGEVTPGAPQEEDGVALEQRSATPRGAVHPVPEGDPVEIQRRKESSAAKAEGAVVPPASTSTVNPAGSPKVTDTTPRAKSQKRKQPSAKKGTAARKRPARTVAQKAARRARDAAKRKGSK